MLIKKIVAIVAVCVFAAPIVAQEQAESVSEAVSVSKNVQVMLNAEGVLEGVAVVEGKTPVPVADAKISLTANGKVVDEVKTDEKGNFSFANVAPGAYQMMGTADGFVGSQSFDVAGFAPASSCSACSLGMNAVSSDVAYDSFSQAPLGSFSSSCGGGIGGGGRLGGGRGILGSRLGRLGLIGGVVAIAVSGDNDASPDR
jgi:hypothetical protein